MAFSPLECVIVDDSLFIREQLSSIIRDGGHNVLATYDNGNKLLAQLQLMTIDVIFLDIILPEITGFLESRGFAFIKTIEETNEMGTSYFKLRAAT